MGVEIKQNKKGQYQLISTISDERLHEKLWISLKEAKKVFIERAWFRFVEQVVEIGMDFPAGHRVNEKMQFTERTANEFILKNLSEKDYENVYNKFHEIIKENKVDLNFES